MDAYQDSAAPSRSLLVVVVEDQSDRSAGAAELLAMCGFQVCAAADYLEAVCIAAERAADVLVIDLDLPGPDAFEVARRVSAVSSLMLVALGGDAEFGRRASAAAGFHFHFPKPLDPAPLVGCLRRLSCLMVGAAD
jgi:CheY-like chemotaxis protein